MAADNDNKEYTAATFYFSPPESFDRDHVAATTITIGYAPSDPSGQSFAEASVPESLQKPGYDSFQLVTSSGATGATAAVVHARRLEEPSDTIDIYLAVTIRFSIQFDDADLIDVFDASTGEHILTLQGRRGAYVPQKAILDPGDYHLRAAKREAPEDAADSEQPQ